MTDAYFVGRTEHMTRILGGASGTGRIGTFFDVEGIPGIGKTSLLEQLVRAVEEQGGTAVRIDGGDFPARGRGAGAPLVNEATEFRQFRVMLRGALERLPPDDEATGSVLDILTVRKPGFLSSDSVSTPVDPAEVTRDAYELLDLATSAATGLAASLAAMQTRLLVVADDFHILAGRPLGQWVMDLIAGIEGADVVVLHQQVRNPADLGMPSSAVPLPLGNLDFDDVEAYLKSHPGVGPDVAGIVGHVWDFTEGHPQALALVADLIKESGRPENSIALMRQLGALQGGMPGQLAALVNRILDGIADEELRDALYNLCVTRHFDLPLLQKLFGDLDERHAQTIIDRLRHYSFIDQGDADQQFLTISEFVRRFGENRLDAVRRQNIHVRAADYYKNLIVEEAAEDDTSYQSWYRYEQKGFQTLERDWLYHLSRLTGQQRKIGRTGIARIFLDAFWWWGYYIPFPFCEQVLADWSDATSNDSEDRAWSSALRTLYDKYPKGWRKSLAPKEQWTQVRRALLYIWDRGGFGEKQLEEREMRHVRGMLGFFLADAARFVDPNDPEADTRLNDAAKQFAANNDEWNTAWVEYTRADLALSRDQAEQAMSLVKDSAHNHPDLGDNELLANLHRVYADAQWACRNPGAALDAYARAVSHAYRFQVRGNADDYTAAFQQEMVDRSIERLVALHADDQDEGQTVLRSVCARIHAFFGPYWDAVGADPMANDELDVVRALDEDHCSDVAGALFPAAPTIADLNRPGSEYEYIGKDVTDRMARELAQPPGTPLPST